jgi:hypothetical protein
LSFFRRLRAISGIPEQRLRVLWDCVDVNRFKPMVVMKTRGASWAFHGIPRSILTLGRLDKQARYKVTTA